MVQYTQLFSIYMLLFEMFLMKYIAKRKALSKEIVLLEYELLNSINFEKFGDFIDLILIDIDNRNRSK